MTPAAFLQTFAQAIANDGGLVLLFVVIFITGVRKVWVFGHVLTEFKERQTDERIGHMAEMALLREERDSWRRIALYQQSQRGPQPPPPLSPLEGD